MPLAYLWTKLPLPVTDFGCRLSVPWPLISIVSPLGAREMSGHGFGTGSVHWKSVPKSQR